MDLFIYLAKASLILKLFWVIYKLFLEAETYHRFKRIYLLAGYVFSQMLSLLPSLECKKKITLSMSNINLFHVTKEFFLIKIDRIAFISFKVGH